MKQLRTILQAGILSFAMAAACAGTPIPRTILQEFRAGSGPEAIDSKGGLLIEIPPDSLPDEDDIFAAGVFTICKLDGDFDLRVKYHQVAWPRSNGVRFGLKAADVAIERTSFTTGDAWPQGEAYLDSRFIAGSIYTGDRFGQLRVTRLGNVIATYYRSPSTDGFWKRTGTGAGTSEPTTVFVGAWSHPPYFIYETTRIFAFDLTLAKGHWLGEHCPGSDLQEASP